MKKNPLLEKLLNEIALEAIMGRLMETPERIDREETLLVLSCRIIQNPGFLPRNFHVWRRIWMAFWITSRKWNWRDDWCNPAPCRLCRNWQRWCHIISTSFRS